MTAIEVERTDEVRSGYFKRYYSQKSDNILARIRATQRIKRIMSISVNGPKAPIPGAGWMCLSCDVPMFSNNARMAERHADLLGHRVVFRVVGDRSACYHQCRKCGIISSCQGNPRYHVQTFEFSGPCSLCDDNKES